MTKDNRIELDVISGEKIITELTSNEIAERKELAAANEATRNAEELAKATAKAELLDRLGITAEEATLLLG
jgi:hypothetical protein